MSIRLESLSKRYDGHPVVNNVSLEVTEGEFFVLLGPSGTGKSVFLKTLVGLLKPEKGHVWVGDRDLPHLPEAQIPEALAFIRRKLDDLQIPILR